MKRILPLFALFLACSGLFAQDVNITFNVATSEIEVAETGIFIAGGGLFGEPGDFALSDDDGDGVWSITVTREAGFGGNYTFTNGNCPDYSCKENIGGQPCADAGNFNDRILPPVMSDTVINTCFAQCTDEATCMAVSSSLVTFQVDASEFADPIAEVDLAGNFEGWGGSIDMLDNDGDGIYVATVELAPGAIEYKFVINRQYEEFAEATPGCTQDFGGYINRVYTVAGDGTIAPVCYASCEACMPIMNNDSVSITFNVATSEIEVAETGLYIAGGGLFGNPGDFAMADDDGDGIWSITVTREIGFGGNYTFTNGNCPDYSCKENIGGQPCADAANFNDRILPPVMNDTIINTCFAQCTDEASCMAVVESMITFQVDVSDFADPIEMVQLAGNFEGWGGSIDMTDDDGDNIYQVTIPLASGAIEYKFVINRQYEEFAEATPGCTENFGGYINRIYTVDGDDTRDVVCYASCDACSVNVVDLAAYGISFELYPTMTNDLLNVRLNQGANQESTLQVLSTDGRLIQTLALNGDQQRQLDVSNLAAGFYFVRVQHADAVGVQRFIKQ